MSDYGREVFTLSNCRNDRALVKLIDRLLSDAEDDQGFPQEFLDDLVHRLKENSALDEHFEETLRALSTQLAEMSMSDNYKPYITAFGRLVQHKPVVNLLVNLPEFLPPEVPANLLEKKTLLGPFFQLSPAQVYSISDPLVLQVEAGRHSNY